LDEPTAGLDLRFQHEALRLIRQLAADRGLAVVISLHDFNLAALYADRLAVLAARSVVAIGSPQEVLTAEVIEQAFGIPVTILQHPIYGTPLVAALGEDASTRRGASP
jgi:iron complex transport system ATP-binding protein